MNRAELRALAQDRIDDAAILLTNGRWAAAYYLAGYAVECALKACILAFVEQTGAIFRDKRFSEKCFTHNLEDLLRLANLEADLGLAIQANAALDTYWEVVKDWTEISRYQPKGEPAARALYEAITHNPDGVFLWLQKHW